MPENFHLTPARLRPKPAIETHKAIAGILPELAGLSKEIGEAPTAKKSNPAHKRQTRENMADGGLEILTNPDIIGTVPDYPQTR